MVQLSVEREKEVITSFLSRASPPFFCFSFVFCSVFCVHQNQLSAFVFCFSASVPHDCFLLEEAAAASRTGRERIRKREREFLLFCVRERERKEMVREINKNHSTCFYLSWFFLIENAI